MGNRGSNIPRNREDEHTLNNACLKAYEYIKSNFLCYIPDNWNIEIGSDKLFFNDIVDEYKKSGLGDFNIEQYYGLQGNKIETDCFIIYLTIFDGVKKIKKPLFMGEMKKQGTNAQRIKEGKNKQAQGNAACDRITKNYEITSDYAYICDREHKFFPYNVYLHGCDFSDDSITSTSLSKLIPFFGKLNVLNPWFDQDALQKIACHKGGSCFYQEKDFTHEQLYESCCECCKKGIRHYLIQYGEYEYLKKSGL